MSEAMGITVSSNLSSANASSAISNHSGKANRMKFDHANPDIDKQRTHMNVEFDLHDRDELLHKHYDAMIEKHNRQNNSAARRWDLETYLKTFEGKPIKVAGKETKNKRWATATQISYFGGKDTLNPILNEIEAAGATREEINATYAEGYREYVERHNEKFPTLPIYHSDVHFDETTPHGHDAIVIMGHTEKGKPSDSINNALGELYGYKTKFEDKRENMARYRDENDDILFTSIASKLEALGAAYNVDLKFELIRLRETGSLDYKAYKQAKELEAWNEELQDMDHEYKMNLRVQKDSNLKIRERDKESMVRSAALDAREGDLAAREGVVIARERELQEKEREVAERLREEKVMLEREVETLRGKIDFLQMVEVMQPKVLDPKELRGRLHKLTGGAFDFAGPKSNPDVPVIWDRRDPSKPIKSTAAELVGHVYNMRVDSDDGTTVDMEHEQTRELSYLMGHMKFHGLPHSDYGAHNLGFDVVVNAVRERENELTKERERERQL